MIAPSSFWGKCTAPLPHPASGKPVQSGSQDDIRPHSVCIAHSALTFLASGTENCIEERKLHFVCGERINRGSPFFSLNILLLSPPPTFRDQYTAPLPHSVSGIYFQEKYGFKVTSIPTPYASNTFFWLFSLPALKYVYKTSMKFNLRWDGFLLPVRGVFPRFAKNGRKNGF
jgi:hypothetical protein